MKYTTRNSEFLRAVKVRLNANFYRTALRLVNENQGDTEQARQYLRKHVGGQWTMGAC